MKLEYHALTLRLLGRQPEKSPEALEAMERCEAACGRKLPAAVREWYSMVDAETLLETDYGEGVLLPLAKVLAGFARVNGNDSAPELLVYEWADPFAPGMRVLRVVVGLDASDDPLVRYVYVDFTVPPMQRATFTEFVLGQAWQKRAFSESYFRMYVGPTGRNVWKTESGPIGSACVGPPYLDYLLERFEELPQEGMPPGQRERFFRFFSPAGRVSLATDGDPRSAVCAAYWNLTADTEEAAVDLYVGLELCHGVPVSLASPADKTVRWRIKDCIRRRVPGVRFW
jgi:hypothetical protein